MMDFKNHIAYREKSLKKLLRIIIQYEDEIIESLYKDFKKPAFESTVTETGYVINDLKDTIKHLRKWSKPKRVRSSILNFPSTDFIYSEPYGEVLIISPWNYPFQLALCPLVAAVAAGNKVVLKPSELTPATSGVISKIIRETFDVKHVVAILGDASIAEKLLQQRWDYIFFTGSVPVGKRIAKAAAENLTPVTLELGGKNPCIVDKTAAIALSAKRIVWGKFINAGQTCIAPDYIIAHKNIKASLIEQLQYEIEQAYSEDPEQSPDYPRIINSSNWKRLISLIDLSKVIYGGKTNEPERYIAPTLIDEPSLDSEIMKHEIFGPLLPILSYEDEKDLNTIINKYEKPLSLYTFTQDQDFAERMIQNYSFGGGCINDTIIHFSNKRLPFGGVGHSGMGSYHGKSSFDVFSHKKAIVKKANWMDLPFRYAPYGNKLKTIKKLLNWL
jgi:aldehyde dehydrogenase (NAD+)